MRMPRPNKHGLPPGLRRTERDGLVIDLWYRDQSGKKRRLREVLGDVPLVMARDVLAKRRTEIIGGKLAKGMPVRTTFVGAFKEYLEWAEETRPRSMRFRRVAAKRLCARFKNEILSDITPWHLERYKKDMLKTLAPATVDLDIAAFKHMISHAASWGGISYERAAELRKEVKLLRVDNARVRYLSVEEKDALIAACPADLREIVVAAINLGGRAGELRSLTWDKVDLDGRTVIVRRTKGKKPSLTRIHINDELLPQLQAAWARRKPGATFVFTTKTGRAWKASWMEECFALARTAARIEDFHFHDLRHHFASTLVQRGIGLQRVQKLLGHTRITTSERYAHLAPDVDRAVDVLVEGGTVRLLDEARLKAKEKP
jgi:integrase